jgi:hypothetical protein
MRLFRVLLLISGVAGCSSSQDDVLPQNAIVLRPSVSQSNGQCDSASWTGKQPGEACTADGDCAWTCCACNEVPLASVMTDDCDGKKLQHVLALSYSSRQCIGGRCANHDDACAYAASTFHMCRCMRTAEL